MIKPLRILLPTDLNEALTILTENKNSHIIAGGTDIVPGLAQESNRFKNIRLLVDINRIKELKGITIENGIISIGTAETFSNIVCNSVVKTSLPLLAEACSTIGSVQIRNRATIGGNFVNNAPCADSVPALLVYNASVKIESSGLKRELLLADFLSGPYITQLKENEIVTSINIPVPVKHYGGSFYKLGRRRAVAISRITLALLLSIKDKKIDEIRIASGAVTPIGTRFADLEMLFAGKEISGEMIKSLSAELGENILKVTGLRWSSEYKIPVVQQVFYQMLHNAIYRGGNDE